MIYDLTHRIENGMPVFPGTADPTLMPANTIQQDGFAETSLAILSHTGTHMDAPAHMLPGAPELDQLDVSAFCGSAIVVDCSHLRGRSITREVLRPYEAALADVDFVLFRTGFESLWGSEAFFGDFPVPDQDCIEFLAASNLKGLGSDAISIDRIADAHFPNHMVLFHRNMINLENLCLAALPEGRPFSLYALPLHFHHADGAPIRAIAVV